ncbi:MAG: hypothetical protein M1605_01315 [Candidatus Thermoplasmatota archaeon]|nr:hypothetical protein [Candidatus Thermoplasmatota archaeon]
MLRKNIVIVVEDNQNTWPTIEVAINEAAKNNNVAVTPDFKKDLQELGEIEVDSCENYVLMVLDLNLTNQQDSVQSTINGLVEMSKSLFIPAVIYSAYTDDISEKLKRNWHFFRVVNKSSAINNNLSKEISDLLGYRMALVNIEDEIRKQFRSISIETLDRVFQAKDQVEYGAVSAMMISRLVSYLTRRMDIMTGTDDIPAEAMIIYPPLQKDEMVPISMGDVLKDSEGKLWLVVSPTCDMAVKDDRGNARDPKIKNVLLMRCFTCPKDKEAYVGGTKPKLQDEKERTVALKVPSDVSDCGILVVHTKFYETRPYSDIKDWVRVLSVASPYAEDIKATVMRDIMRIGAPDTSPRREELISSFIKCSTVQ